MSKRSIWCCMPSKTTIWVLERGKCPTSLSLPTGWLCYSHSCNSWLCRVRNHYQKTQGEFHCYHLQLGYFDYTQEPPYRKAIILAEMIDFDQQRVVSLLQWQQGRISIEPRWSNWGLLNMPLPSYNWINMVILAWEEDSFHDNRSFRHERFGPATTNCRKVIAEGERNLE